MSIRLIKKFHGHLGIWVSVGYIAGKYAKKVLKPDSYKDLKAEVYIIKETPYSCALDGLQLSSCCTLGKGNLIVHKNDEVNPVFVFLNRKTDAFVRLKPKKEVLTEIEIRQKMSKGNVEYEEEDAKWVLKLKADKLFEVNKSYSK